MIYVLFSGGIDSLGCLVWAIAKFGRDRVRAIYFDVGQCYADRECESAKIIAFNLGVEFVVNSELHLMEDTKTAHIPLRNLSMILNVAMIPEAVGVVFGMLRGESPEDKNFQFVSAVQELLDGQFAKTIYAEKRRFEIYVPVAHKTKGQVVADLLGADELTRTALYATVGCHGGGTGKCGHCLACINRWIAFSNNGIPDEGWNFAWAHPGDALLSKLLTKGVVRKAPWRGKIRWGYDAYRALNRYCHGKYRQSLLRFMVNPDV